MTEDRRPRLLAALSEGAHPDDDGWSGLYGLVGAVAPRGSRRRRVLCGYFLPAKLEVDRESLFYRMLGVSLFGRFIPTGGIEIRRIFGAEMKPYTLAGSSLRAARDFYYRACVFEALHLPFFLALLALAFQRLSIGRADWARKETLLNLAVNFYPMLHHRHTRARIVRLLARDRSRALGGGAPQGMKVPPTEVPGDS